MPEPKNRYRARFYDKSEDEEFTMTFPGRMTFTQAEDRARDLETRVTEFLYLEAV